MIAPKPPTGCCTGPIRGPPRLESTRNRHTYREVRLPDSWISRLGESIKSVAAGALLAGAALPAMWCNEGRAVTTARSLEEGGAAVITLPSDSVDPANDGRLVHLVGRADTRDIVRDPDFGVSANAIRLVRTTEMYQWKEHEQTETRDKPGGGREEIRNYTYYKTWSGSEIGSGAFHSSSAPTNPGRVPFPSTSFTARSVTLGAFTLPRALVEEMKVEQPLAATAEADPAVPRGTNMRRVSDGFYRGRDPAAPEIGDVRVRFGVVRPQVVTVIARQQDASFGPYQTRAGDALQMLEAGPHEAAAMFRAAAVVNRVLTWVVRLAGFLLVCAGVFIVFRPIAVLGDAVPVVGKLLGAGLWLFSFGFAAVLSLATIAAAWVFYRPLFAAALIAAVAATLAWLRRRAARR